MKKTMIKLVAISCILYSGLVVGAPEPIVLKELIKVLKKSIEYPINLYKSTYINLTTGVDADHKNKLFTTRALFRHTPGGLTDFEKKQLRNELCASFKIYTTVANQALDIKYLPGSLGLYKDNDYIVSVADYGFSGERLDSVLRKLSTAPDTAKQYYAKYYAAAMQKNIDAIHTGGIIWNNASINNFYVRPDGLLYAYDFTESFAQSADVPTATAEKEAEVNKLVAESIWPMYLILFGDTIKADTEFQILVLNPNWATAGVDLKARLVATLPNAANIGNFTSGLDGDFNANVNRFLNKTGNSPYLPALNFGFANILRADHGDGNAVNGANNFYVDAGTMAFLPTDVPQTMDTAGAYACSNWTGKE